MEGEQIQTKICEYCQKPFPEQKIDLHEAYCRRNIKKCTVCFQMYDINDQQNHDKQFHSKKDCRYCGLNFPEKQWQAHQPSCKRRPLKCTYCENDIAYEQIIRHEEVCGARTTTCEVCKKFIPLREFDQHKLGCIERQQPLHNQERELSRDEGRNNVREQARINGRDQLRNNVRDQGRNNGRDFPLQRMRSNEDRMEDVVRRRDNYRDFRPYEEIYRRNDRNSNQRLHVVSQDKPKTNLNLKPQIRVPSNVKPSHIIEPQKIRVLVDPVPISIRLAMGHVNHNKPPLQSRN